MKTTAVVIISVIIGFLLGVQNGKQQFNSEVQEKITNLERVIDTAKNFFEEKNSETAKVSMRVIPAIESGDTNRAINILADSIRNYYSGYALRTNDASTIRLQMKESIEAFVKTNQRASSAMFRISEPE